MTGFAAPATEHPVRPDIVNAFTREWEALAAPGSFFSGSEQIAIAAAYRSVRNGESGVGELAPMVAEVVVKLSSDPGAIRRHWVEYLFAGGLEVGRYVEITSVVSRIAAVDGFHRMMGFALPPLPSPTQGSPTGELDPKAAPGKAFVPMIRGTSIWWALTLVPKAYDRMEDLHCVLYLSPEQMPSSESPRMITRPQMELVASRTSLINECFY